MLAIENLKDLGKLIDLCRKKGVEVVKVDGIEIKLGEAPTEAPQRQLAARDLDLPPEAYIPITQQAMAIATEELSEEDLLFYSTRDEQE